MFFQARGPEYSTAYFGSLTSGHQSREHFSARKILRPEYQENTQNSTCIRLKGEQEHILSNLPSEFFEFFFVFEYVQFYYRFP